MLTDIANARYSYVVNEPRPGVRVANYEHEDNFTELL